MKKIKLIIATVIVVILSVAINSCAEEYKYEETLVLDSNSSRIYSEVSDADKTLESQIESLTNNESTIGKTIKLATYKSYLDTELNLNTTLFVEYYLDSLHYRKISYAEATLPVLVGSIPQGSRFRCLPESPICEINHRSRNHDQVIIREYVRIDYGNYFVENDDDYEDRYYTKIISAIDL